MQLNSKMSRSPWKNWERHKRDSVRFSHKAQGSRSFPCAYLSLADAQFTQIPSAIQHAGRGPKFAAGRARADAVQLQLLLCPKMDPLRSFAAGGGGCGAGSMRLGRPLIYLFLWRAHLGKSELIMRKALYLGIP